MKKLLPLVASLGIVVALSLPVIADSGSGEPSAAELSPSHYQASLTPQR